MRKSEKLFALWFPNNNDFFDFTFTNCNNIHGHFNGYKISDWPYTKIKKISRLPLLEEHRVENFQLYIINPEIVLTKIIPYYYFTKGILNTISHNHCSVSENTCDYKKRNSSFFQTFLLFFTLLSRKDCTRLDRSQFIIYQIRKMELLKNIHLLNLKEEIF